MFGRGRRLMPKTKLIPCWFVGQRDAGCAYHFIHKSIPRLANRAQLTTDGGDCNISAALSHSDLTIRR